MYPVASNFHNLSIQDAPKTRIRIYFIGDSVDCTDDADVVANGTLLVGKAGDTDSNGRIASSGVVFNEMFNPEKNVKLGSCVSSQISMTLMNFDGALNGYAFGRCKVYIDVYDATNSTWLVCPMGVYIIEQPTKTRQRLIACHGYDQMQLLDTDASAWWDSITWSNQPSMYDLVDSMATQLGVSVSNGTATAMQNTSITYNFRPFDATGFTYRQILALIGEASGTIARFDRDGALDLRWFDTPTIGGNPISINTGTTGNQCLSIDVAEYEVAQYGVLDYALGVQTATATHTPSADNEYSIKNNAFLNPSNPNTVVAYLSNILDRLYAVGAYYPIQAKLIMDWSVEAGDIIQIVSGGTTYSLPIYQQRMVWRGGYVVSDAMDDGDPNRPVSANYVSVENASDEKPIIYFQVPAAELGQTSKLDLQFFPGQSALIALSLPSAVNRQDLIIVSCVPNGTITYKAIVNVSSFTYETYPYMFRIKHSNLVAIGGMRINFQ